MSVWSRGLGGRRNEAGEAAEEEGGDGGDVALGCGAAGGGEGGAEDGQALLDFGGVPRDWRSPAVVTEAG